MDGLGTDIEIQLKPKNEFKSDSEEIKKKAKLVKNSGIPSLK